MDLSILINLWWFIVAIVCFNLTPGPDFLLAMRSGLKEGFAKACIVVGGMTVSCTVWAIIAAVGLSQLLASSKLGFMLLNGAGGAYLAWIGVQSIWSVFAKKAQTLDSGDLEIAKTGDASKLFRLGFLTDFFNPQTAIFIVSFFPRFIPSQTHGVMSFFLLLSFLQMIAMFAALAFVSFLSARGSKLLTHPRILQIFDVVSGLIFIGFGIQLLLDNAKYFH